MAIKKTYVSDLSGETIEGNPSVVVIQRSVRKKSRYGNYTNYEQKKIHLTTAEASAFLTSEIRQWLGFEKPPVVEKTKVAPKAKKPVEKHEA